MAAEWINTNIQITDLNNNTGHSLSDSNTVTVRIRMHERFMVEHSKLREAETIFTGEGNTESVALSQALVRLTMFLNDRKFEHTVIENGITGYWDERTPVHVVVSPGSQYESFINSFLFENLKINLWGYKPKPTQ